MNSRYSNPGSPKEIRRCRCAGLPTGLPNGMRNGLSLLEMILATAILMAGALTIARLSFVTSSHVMRAQDDSIALQIAAYQLEQIRLKRRPAESTPLQPVIPENSLESLAAADSVSTAQRNTVWQDWSYSITVQPTRRPSISKVQINVFRFPPGSSVGGVAGSDVSGSDPPSGNSSAMSSGNGSANLSTPGTSGEMASAVSEGDAAIYQQSFVTLLPTSPTQSLVPTEWGGNLE